MKTYFVFFKVISVERPDESVDLNDREFLKAYGISSQEEGAGVRATEILIRFDGLSYMEGIV